MSIELVTGHAGAPHVSGSDVGFFNAGIVGDGAFILRGEPDVSMSDANTLTIAWGQTDLVVHGRHVHMSGNDSVSIVSGSQSGYRHDIVYLRYEHDAETAVETCSLVPVTGTTVASEAAAEDPETAYSGASILDGASIVDIPIARVTLNGLTPAATWLLVGVDTITDVMSGVDELESNVAIRLNGCHVYAGSKVKDIGSTAHYEATLWIEDEFKSLFNCSKPQQAAVMVSFGSMNPPSTTTSNYTPGPMNAEYWTSGIYQGWHVHFNAGLTGQRRFSYVVIVPDAISTV